MTIDELNTCDRMTFVDVLGGIFEDSPWVAERTWGRRPFADREHLHSEMGAVVAEATHEEQLALLRAHPDLGARARMSEASTSEQAGAGLDRLSKAEFDRLQELNAAYRLKFGHPFLFAVKGSTKYQILDALEHRLPQDPREEFAEALRQVYRIADFRLQALLG